MTVAAALDATLKSAGIPIVGVSLTRDPETRAWDKAGWRVDFADGATDAHREAAQKIVDAFDPDSVPEVKMRPLSIALARITVEEFATLKKARADHIEIDLLYERGMAPGGIDINSTPVRSGFAKLVELGVFTDERLAALFA